MENLIEELVGKTILSIDGLEVGNDRVEIECSDGTKYLMYHYQNCCESVSIEDIVGDVSDLIGSPILKSSEDCSNDDPEGYHYEGYRDSYTWTFYNFATKKGHVTLRWYGSSNGYYSESVNFVRN